MNEVKTRSPEVTRLPEFATLVLGWEEKKRPSFSLVQTVSFHKANEDKN